MNKISGRSIILLRNLIFGIEDSLVSTLGLLSGIASQGVSKSAIILTGTILIFVEAFSMAVGSYLSEESVGEYISKYEIIRDKNFNSLWGAIVMLFSYLLAGSLILWPYIFIYENYYALIFSIISALIALIILGLVSAYKFNLKIMPQVIKMFVLGGSAVIIGVLAGKLVEYLS